MLEALHNLSTESLRALAASLRGGPLALGLSRPALAQAVGAQVSAVQATLERLGQQGMTPAHLALLIAAMVGERERATDPPLLFDLVLSGPEVPGMPTADTAAAVQTLIESAGEEAVLVGYTVHNGKRMFRRLAERMDAVPSLRVTFCLDIARKPTDTSLSSEIVRRFAADFVKKHWPGNRLPEVFYDPRALAAKWEDRASLHAKCVIVDRSAAMVTSANFTEAAHRKNIEAGVLIRYPPFVARLSDYFLALRSSGQLQPCPLS